MYLPSFPSPRVDSSSFSNSCDFGSFSSSFSSSSLSSSSSSSLSSSFSSSSLSSSLSSSSSSLFSSSSASSSSFHVPIKDPPTYNVAMQEPQSHKQTAQQLPPPKYESEDGSVIFTRPSEIIRLSAAFHCMLQTKIKRQPDYCLIQERAQRRELWAMELIANWLELVDNDVAGAIQMYEQASLEPANEKTARSEFMIAHLLLTRYPSLYGVRPISLAIAWLRRALATDQNMADALFVLGCLSREGCYFEAPDLRDKDAEEFWLAAAKLGHGPAQRRLRQKLNVPVSFRHILT